MNTTKISNTPILLSCGSNGSGQLGLGHADDVSSLRPVALPGVNAEATVKDICGGGNHTVLLLDSGDIYTCGLNEDGRCGHNIDKYHQSPTFLRVEIVDSASHKWRCIAASWECSFLVSSDGRRVFACGTGRRGELGLGDSTISATLQELDCFLPDDSQIMGIKACVGHVIVFTDNGEVFGWGDGRKGQLGLPLGLVWKPRKFSNLSFPVKAAACGREFTVLAGSPESGQYCIMGSNKWNIKSNAMFDSGILHTEIPNTIPREIKNWLKISAGWGSITVLYKDFRCIGWGRNDHGQLPPQLPRIEDVTMGSEHGIARTQDGAIVAWGWGEHGNTGLAKDEKPAKWQILTSLKELDRLVNHTEVFIAAGCATSWVYIR
jgi:protein ATS1